MIMVSSLREETFPAKNFILAFLLRLSLKPDVEHTSHGTIGVTIIVRSLYIRDSRHIH